MDGAWIQNAGQHRVKFKKGGWLPGMGSSFVAVTGGFAFVLAKNGNTPDGVDVNWYDTVKPLAQAHDWGTTDRFPSFGMAALPATATRRRIRADTDDLPDASFMQLIETSMARGFASRVTTRPRIKRGPNRGSGR